MSRFVMADPRQLQPHPLNFEVFGDDDLTEDFTDDVQVNGVQTCIEVAMLKETSDGMVLPQKPIILKGHRRWKAAMKAGLEEVPLVVRDVVDPVEAELQLLRDNLPALRRHLTPEMLGRAVLAIEKRLEAKSDRKRGRPGVRRQAAREAGVDPKTARAAVAVTQAADDLASNGKVEEARALLQRAAQNVQRAAQEARGLQDVPEVIPDPKPVIRERRAPEVVQVARDVKERRRALMKAEEAMNTIGKCFVQATKADGPVDNPDMRQCMAHFEELKGAIAGWIRKS
jgi:ParB-like chromosome segregation protein Spo0J